MIPERGTPDERSVRTSAAFPLARFLAFLVLALATRAVVLGIGIVDLDEASYATAAREMLRGSHLYVDVADHKPPLIFAWYVLAQWLLARPC